MFVGGGRGGWGKGLTLSILISGVNHSSMFKPVILVLFFIVLGIMN